MPKARKRRVSVDDVIHILIANNKIKLKYENGQSADAHTVGKNQWVQWESDYEFTIVFAEYKAPHAGNSVTHRQGGVPAQRKMDQKSDTYEYAVVVFEDKDSKPLTLDPQIIIT